jgi:Rrf2 family protein
MLSLTAEYALRIMIYLTELKDGFATSEQIAYATNVPAGYTVKVLQQLGRGGYVSGQRGRNGGFYISCNPSEVNLLQIVNVIDPLKRITQCPLGRADHNSVLCPLHSQLDKAIGVLQRNLEGMTLQDVVDNADGKTLCQDAL